MKSTNKITKVTFSTLLLFVTLITQAQLSDLHYLPPLKQKAGGIVNQLIYLSTPNTTPFTVNVYKGTSSTVLTTLTNYGYLLYTLNMLKSLQPYGLDKRVFIVCIDKRGALVLRNRGYTVYCVDDMKLGKFCPWNTPGYEKICYLPNK